jgi:hypothetical protein
MKRNAGATRLPLTLIHFLGKPHELPALSLITGSAHVGERAAAWLRELEPVRVVVEPLAWLALPHGIKHVLDDLAVVYP